MYKFLKKGFFILLFLTGMLFLFYSCNEKVDISDLTPLVPPDVAEVSGSEILEPTTTAPSPEAVPDPENNHSLMPDEDRKSVSGQKLRPEYFPWENITIPGKTYVAYDADGKIILEEKYYDYTLQIDLSRQVILLDAPEAIESGGDGEESALYPSLEGIGPNSFISASIIFIKAKQFDDGLYAAVEIAAQEGTGDFHGKKVLLSSIHKALKEMEGKDADYFRALILSSAELGGQEFEEDKEIKKLAEKIKMDFIDHPHRSTPLGFYTWNRALTEIFQQDRLLQTRMTRDDFLNDEQHADVTFVNYQSLVDALNKSGESASYVKYMELIEKLTNPFIEEVSDFRPLIDITYENKQTNVYAFFPPSSSYETELTKKLFRPADPIPENFNLADTLIEKIQSRSLDINPEKDSG